MTEDEMIGWHHRLNEHEFEVICETTGNFMHYSLCFLNEGACYSCYSLHHMLTQNFAHGKHCHRRSEICKTNANRNKGRS